MFVSVMTFAEIRRGIELLQAGKRRESLEEWLEMGLLASFLPANILPVSDVIANRWAILSAKAQKRGVQVTVIDGLLAATAQEHGLTMATRNVKHFSDLSIPLFDPWRSEADPL